ncbi:ZIP family metal transporter [Altibacter sp. HG106]|uniref:ZIP family metal transporter n=1 Tax=Altibacter sp. HG106 TaxID=3023937 RepID=UPI002350AA19|nr:ZIP family metal transporter [Altibacter sp. HG106]MDC7996168.1 ZIP family metal transporter [Altibacter sp. HG106]
MTYIFLVASVLIGYLLASWIGKKNNILPFLLAFSGAFLLSITLFEMLPQVFSSDSEYVGVYIMCGILLQIILDFFSKGAEHGHVHLPHNQYFPWMLFVSLFIHAFLEGFPVHDNHHVLFGVIIHKIPIAAILSAYFIQAKYARGKILLFLGLFALATPLGSFLQAQYIPATTDQLVPINAVVIGVFLHVSTTILFESNKDHRFNFTKLLVIMLGVIMAWII